MLEAARLQNEMRGTAPFIVHIRIGECSGCGTRRWSGSALVGFKMWKSPRLLSRASRESGIGTTRLSRLEPKRQSRPVETVLGDLIIRMSTQYCNVIPERGNSRRGDWRDPARTRLS